MRKVPAQAPKVQALRAAAVACALAALAAPAARAAMPATPAAPTPAQPAQPGALPVITWAVQDFPPINILRDGAAPASPAALGNGIADQLLRELVTRLPQYRHEFRLASRQRIWAAMRQGDNVCDPGALKTPEREQWAYFTPALLVPPLALVVRADHRQRITGGGGTVALRELLKKDFKGGIEPSRSYGDVLDPLLRHPDAPTTPDTSTSAAAMLHLVALGRYDYTVDYPMVVRYVQLNLKLPAPLAVVPLREAQDWLVDHVACTRNAWGETVVRDVDAALRAAARTPALRGVLAAWLPPAYYKTNEPRIRAFIDQRQAAPRFSERP